MVQTRSDSTRWYNGMVEKLSKMDESNIASERHLWEIKEAFSKLAGTLSAQEMQAAAAGQQSMLLEALLKEMRQTRQWLAQVYAASPQ